MLFVRCNKEFAQSAHNLGYHELALQRRDQLLQGIQSNLRNPRPEWSENLKSKYLICLRERAISLLELKEWDQARSDLQSVVSGQKKTLSAANPELLLSRTWLAKAYSRVGQHDKAFDQRLEVYTQRK